LPTSCERKRLHQGSTDWKGAACKQHDDDDDHYITSSSSSSASPSSPSLSLIITLHIYTYINLDGKQVQFLATAPQTFQMALSSFVGQGLYV
jgi:hypothetical protein